MDIRASERTVAAEQALAALAEQFPASARERLQQGPLFMPPHVLRRVVFLNELYKLVLPVPGIVMQLGVRYGRDLAVFESLRTLHEPLNPSRKIVGFDTFTGFPAVDARDGDFELATVGALGTATDYPAFLERVLSEREQLSPFEHVRKFEVVTGDAGETLPRYLADNPHTIVALAYFDMDLYAPTKRCLELVRPYLTRGSVVAFDELNCAEWPGETLAVREVLGLSTYALRRFPTLNPGLPSFLVIE
jgi:hypothetical protein